jgi:hypothetical protein
MSQIQKVTKSIKSIQLRSTIICQKSARLSNHARLWAYVCGHWTHARTRTHVYMHTHTHTFLYFSHVPAQQAIYDRVWVKCPFVRYMFHINWWGRLGFDPSTLCLVVGRSTYWDVHTVVDSCCLKSRFFAMHASKAKSVSRALDVHLRRLWVKDC